MKKITNATTNALFLRNLEKQSYDSVTTFDFVLVKLSKLIMPIIFNNNPLKMAGFLSEIENGAMSYFGGYLYCSRQLQKLPKSNFDAEALRNLIIELKHKILENSKEKVTARIYGFAECLLFDDPKMLDYGINMQKLIDLSDCKFELQAITSPPYRFVRKYTNH